MEVIFILLRGFQKFIPHLLHEPTEYNLIPKLPFLLAFVSRSLSNTYTAGSNVIFARTELSF